MSAQLSKIGAYRLAIWKPIRTRPKVEAHKTEQIVFSANRINSAEFGQPPHEDPTTTLSTKSNAEPISGFDFAISYYPHYHQIESAEAAQGSMVCSTLSVSALISPFRPIALMGTNFSNITFYKLYKRIPNYLKKAEPKGIQNRSPASRCAAPHDLRDPLSVIYTGRPPFWWFSWETAQSPQRRERRRSPVRNFMLSRLYFFTFSGFPWNNRPNNLSVLAIFKPNW